MNVLGPRGRGHISQYVHRLLDEFSYFLLLPILVASPGGEPPKKINIYQKNMHFTTFDHN
jgi:hypothetical protein